jgi:restriction system protein
MAIPDYQSIMLPLLKLAGDQKEHRTREAIEYISDLFALTEQERSEPIPSGPQPVIENRVGWAKTYLTKARLLERTQRSFFKITDLGLEVLARQPDRIDSLLLRQFPGFVEFTRGRRDADNIPDELPSSLLQTPQDLLDSGHRQIRGELADELLATVMQSTPAFFEHLVVDLLVRMGYGGSHKDAGAAVGRSGDGGIDGIIKEDKLGLDVIYVQAKRWTGTVGAKDVRDFVGSLAGHHASKGVFITTSSFTRDAADFVKNVQQKVILIDGPKLADLMIDHGVGVSTVTTYDVKKVDADYFVEE